MSMIDCRDIFVWVIAPTIETSDANLQYYYDYTQSIAEYTQAFAELGCEWQWANVTFGDRAGVIERIRTYPTSKTKVVINLCDGDELNGIPGVSVIDLLEENELVYTGSDRHFYEITTSKIPMKDAFDGEHVPTPAWQTVDGETEFDMLSKTLGDTIIVKPAISAGSMGVSLKNVVTSKQQFQEVMADMTNGYRGWKLDTGGILAETFIKGREFTTLVVGSSGLPSGLHVYPAVERVFHSSLPEKERFLSFERLWETYDKESPLPGKASLYTYHQVDGELYEKLTEISLKAYKSVGGTGYGRLDIRMDSDSGNLYVLEVNAQCGLSEDENYTSIGAILRFAQKTFSSLILEIMEDAMERYGAKHKARQ